MSILVNRVAQVHGVSPQEVESDMKLAIMAGMANRNQSPQAKAFWDKLSPNGEVPTVEEFIAAFMEEIPV